MTSVSPEGTVFVVDDDGSFRAAVSRLLRAAGHQVKVFASASEFLQSLPAMGSGCHGDIPTSGRAMRLGAEDFLTKRAPKEALLDAVNRALARERAERTRVQEARARFEALTGREREVLEHVLRGQLNKQIAGDLGIHERTVKLHRTAITTKVGVQSVAELTQLWMEAFPKGQ
jgi:FixJ family two-component response regulator